MKRRIITKADVENKMAVDRKKYKFYIGIDTGVTTGFAIWSREEKKLICVDGLKIHIAMGRIQQMKIIHPGEVFVRVEDARLRTWIPRQKDEKAEAGRRQGAGSVMRDASIWEDFLNDENIPFELVAPRNNKTKMKADYFKQLTKYEGKTNAHGRDAAALVIGI